MTRRLGQCESRLKQLITANKPENRYSWAKEWKKRSGRVLGTLCTFVPTEIMVAAGIMPVRIFGKWTSEIEDALAIRSANSSSYCNHVLQSYIDGEFDFLDGVVCSTYEQDVTRLWDVWDHLGKTRFNYIIHLPDYVSGLTLEHYAGEIGRLKNAVEAFTHEPIKGSAMSAAIDLCNTRRSLVMRLYEMRKRDRPPLSGAEMLGITLAGTIMPVAQFNRELERLLPYLETRVTTVSPRPRLLISGDYVDNPDELGFIESLGCLIASDDFDTGIRNYDGLVNKDGDPLKAMAARYLTRSGSARMAGWGQQADNLIQRVHEFKIDGVIDLSLRYSRAREIRRPTLLKALRQAGIEAIGIEAEYVLSQPAQVMNRVQAFLEMLQDK